MGGGSFFHPLLKYIGSLSSNLRSGAFPDLVYGGFQANTTLSVKPRHAVIPPKLKFRFGLFSYYTNSRGVGPALCAVEVVFTPVTGVNHSADTGRLFSDNIVTGARFADATSSCVDTRQGLTARSRHCLATGSKH